MSFYIALTLYSSCKSIGYTTSEYCNPSLSSDDTQMFTCKMSGMQCTELLDVFFDIILHLTFFLLCSLIPLGSYIPEGLMTSCTWDYVTYTLANRSYTMMLCCFVFFIPLGIILYCYLLMFLAIRRTSRYRCIWSFQNYQWRNTKKIHFHYHRMSFCIQ